MMFHDDYYNIEREVKGVVTHNNGGVWWFNGGNCIQCAWCLI